LHGVGTSYIFNEFWNEYSKYSVTFLLWFHITPRTLHFQWILKWIFKV